MDTHAHDSTIDSAGLLDAARLRDDFPILSKPVHGNRQLTYLDNAATTQKPRQVIAALVDAYETCCANVHRGSHWLSDLATGKYEEAREALRRFVHASSANEVVFTSGCTGAINLVARSWGDANVKSGDEILITEMEHHANIVPWQQLVARTGAVLRWAPVTEDGRLALDRFDELLTPKVKLLAVTAISNVLGTINPTVELTRRAKAVGAAVLIDAAQAVPHERVDFQAIGCDFLTFSAHKMLGPTGIGALIAKEAVLDAMPPALGGGNMIRTVTTDGFTTATLPAKFEAGTPPIAEAIAWTSAIEYLERIGLDRIHSHERAMTIRAHQMLEEIGGVRFLGPPPAEKAGIVSFTLDGAHPADVNAVLDRRGVAIRIGHHCAMPLHKRLGPTASHRASFYLYNPPEDVDRLAEALRDAKRKLRLA